MTPSPFDNQNTKTPEQEAQELALEWDADPRWDGVTRDYTAEDVIKLRGRVQEEHTLAKRGSQKLWAELKDDQQDGNYINALGALTGNQAVQQVKAGLKAIYLSGWQVAADANLSDRPTRTSRSTRRTRSRRSSAGSITP